MNAVCVAFFWVRVLDIFPFSIFYGGIISSFIGC